MKLYEVLPEKLFQRGKMHHHSDSVKAEMLKEKRIRMVVGLVTPPDPFFYDWEEGIYIYNPIPDGKLRLPLVLEIESVADAVTTFLSKGRGAALVYCEAGRNRSSFLSALIVGRLLGMNGRTALEYVLEKRPNAFSNLEWRAYLETRK